MRTVHAEQNAIAQAAARGVRVRGSTCYVTAYPCWLCTKLLLNAGVKRIVYGQAYRIDERVPEAIALAGCTIEAASSEDGASG